MADLSGLPTELQRDARSDPNGEVSWSDACAVAAVNELTDSGSVVLGLDVRFYDAAGRFYEIPWSSFEPDTSKAHAANVEASRQDALEALARIDELETPTDTVERRVVVTWE
jgi:hypothetical protein